MKLFIVTFFLSLFGTGNSALAAFYDPPRPVLRTVPIEKLFVPSGFDDNDNAQIILYGTFPNTCYSVAPISGRVDVNGRTIIIRNVSYFRSGCWCASVDVPYNQVVELGILPAGHYEIIVENNAGIREAAGTLEIHPAMREIETGTPPPDDFLYALVQDAFIADPDSVPSSLIRIWDFRR